jgi:hypothetical protein
LLRGPGAAGPQEAVGFLLRAVFQLRQQARQLDLLGPKVDETVRRRDRGLAWSPMVVSLRERLRVGRGRLLQRAGRMNSRQPLGAGDPPASRVPVRWGRQSAPRTLARSPPSRTVGGESCAQYTIRGWERLFRACSGPVPPPAAGVGLRYPVEGRQGLRAPRCPFVPGRPVQHLFVTCSVTCPPCCLLAGPALSGWPPGEGRLTRVVAECQGSHS